MSTRSSVVSRVNAAGHDRMVAHKATSQRTALLVGPLPPPYGGQTLMLQSLIEAKSTLFDDYNWWVVPVRFSKRLDENGKFRGRKVWHLVTLLLRVVVIAIAKRPRILYYTPAGPTALPVMRDLVVLSLVRPLFRSTIFHFHAGGVSEVYPLLPRPLRWVYRRAYWYAAAGIKVTDAAPDDPKNLRALSEVVVPNGIPDLARQPALPPMTGLDTRLLFVGVIRESKGVLVLLEALRVLVDSGFRVHLNLVGELESQQFAAELDDRIRAYGLSNCVTFSGVLVGDAKADAYAAADIVCVPTFFESESFGLVAVEAMSFGRPVVATRWRGLVDVVADGETGLLVEPHHSEEFAAAVRWLIEHPAEARAMGTSGRVRFEHLFTLDQHLAAMRRAFDSVLEKEGPAR